MWSGRNLRSALTDTGVLVADVEVVRINESFALEGFLHVEVCSYLGAKHVLVVADDHDRARLIDSYGVFLDKAAEFELSGDLEFMPWTAVPTADDFLWR